MNISLKYKHKKFLAATFLTFILGFVFLFFNQEWFFDGEDWGCIFRSSLISSFQDVKDSFKYGNFAPVERVTISSPHGLPHTGATFFNIYYRPFLILLNKLQFSLFGTNPYGYFLLFITLHIIIALSLFFLLTSITNQMIAFFCSLFFGFHPTLYGWIGKIDYQPHTFGLILTFIALFFFKKNKWISYFLGCFFFLICLLTREALIVLPFFLIILSKLNNKKIQKTPLCQSNQVIFGMICMGFCYLIIRFLAYPLDLSSNSSPNLLANMLNLSWIKERLPIFASYFHHLPWTLSFPWNTYLLFQQWNLLYIYNLIRIILIAGGCLLFFFNKNKKTLITFILLGILMYWPCFLNKGLSLRIYYECLPFFIIAQALLLEALFDFKNYFVRFFGLFFIGLLITFNAVALIDSMHLIMEYPRILDSGLKNLQKKSIDPERALLIFNAPSRLTTCCILQALELKGITSIATNKYHYCYQLNIHYTCPIDEIKNLLLITTNTTTITLNSLNSNKLYFSFNRDKNLGNEFKAIIHHQSIDNKIHSISITLDEIFLAFDPQILLWLYEDATFLKIQ